ncbi:hypothetical protein N182_00335 [Sinorhizobium sp. GL2]|nr:hypothetical protein N182_00335 [Sinorhizobium sp. GL2]
MDARAWRGCFKDTSVAAAGGFLRAETFSFLSRFVITSRPQRDASVLTLANDPISLRDLFHKKEAPETPEVKDCRPADNGETAGKQ